MSLASSPTQEVTVVTNGANVGVPVVDQAVLDGPLDALLLLFTIVVLVDAGVTDVELGVHVGGFVDLTEFDFSKALPFVVCLDELVFTLLTLLLVGVELGTTWDVDT